MIKEKLMLLEKKGYHNYGVTMRPIRGVIEFETEDGHVYFPQDEFNIPKVSETATGQQKDRCISVDTCRGNGPHHVSISQLAELRKKKE